MEEMFRVLTLLILLLQLAVILRMSRWEFGWRLQPPAPCSFQEKAIADSNMYQAPKGRG